MKKIHLLLFLLTFSFSGFAQFSLSGKVTDKAGVALPSATVQVEVTKQVTLTDNSGNFTLKNLSGEVRVAVSFVGYKTQKLVINVQKDMVLNVQMEVENTLFDDVVVAASRIDNKTPLAHQNITKEALTKQDLGKDLPLLLKNTQSIVTTSDAGAGVGYSGLRIRGSDISRINVTINGVPLNDPESHGVFWVNMPDFAGSVQDIQIQRGVGTSSNGAAAFGASIDMQTISATRKAYGEVSYAGGSFNTHKMSVKAGTGLIQDKFAFNIRLSQLSSDGFIDRSRSDLKSFYANAGYYGEKTTVKLTASSGKEQTYQAWNGIPKFKLNNDKQAMEDYISFNWLSEADAENLRNSGSRTYNKYTYDNETDNYQQDRYQAIMRHDFTDALRLNTTFFYTHGEGYYEQYKSGRKLKDYGIEDVVIGTETIKKSDLIQRKWLKNDFFGANYNLEYNNDRVAIRFGQSYNKYDGDHYGRVRWMQYASNAEIDHEWYNSNSIKEDFSTFAIANINITDNVRAFADLQYRYIDYSIQGTDDDYPTLDHNLYYNFFNPKAGLFWQVNKQQSVYFSYSRANREPSRANIVDVNLGENQPTFETLNDFELGYKFTSGMITAEANAYYMLYNDQLVLTGEINDVGTALMKNVPDSYRAGIELAAIYKPAEWFVWSANATFSQNKIADFTAVIPTYDENWTPLPATSKNIGETTISFSPSVIAHNDFTFHPTKGLSVSLQTKYVGKQFIDNTENDNRSLDAYLLNDISVAYEFSLPMIKNIALRATVHNLFNEEYETNAWFAESIVGGKSAIYDGYFPQAGTHALAGVTIRF